MWANNVESSDREKFDATLEKVLAELEPVALQEQMFCINFFQLDVLSPTSKNTQTTLDLEGAAAMESSIHDVSDILSMIVVKFKNISNNYILS